MANHCPTAEAITDAVRASLRLARSSSELLSLSQLLDIERALRITSVVIEDRIQVKRENFSIIVIDITDSESDEENIVGHEHVGTANPAGGCENEPELPIPGPYPMSPPEMDAIPDHWYVVDCGTEVGIFADSESSDRAVAGVAGGHQTRVKSWSEAAALYNMLRQQGNIARVSA